MKLLSEVIDDLECRVKRLEEIIGIDNKNIYYGIVKQYEDYDLYFEQINGNDCFIIRSKDGKSRIFPEIKFSKINKAAGG